MSQVKFSATPLVYIRVEGPDVEGGAPGDRQDDNFVTADFESFKQGLGIKIAAGAGLAIKGYNSGFYHPQDAEKLLAWLRREGVEETTLP